MHQTGAVLGGDVVGQHHDVRRGPAVVDAGELHELEGPLVGPALHVVAAHGVLDRPALAEDLREQRLGHHERLGAVGGDHVGHVRLRRHGGVGHQRPRRRRPHQQGGPTGVRAGGEREPHVDAGVGDGLVALGELVVGQPGPAARAVRRDAVVLDEQALGVDLLERPPHRLDVGGVHGAVGVAGVDPVAHPLGHLLERVDVPQHGLAAPGVELGDAVGLDVLLAGEAELLLHGELDGQAVAVPAGLPVDEVALHGLEAGEDVLEDARLDVVGAGPAVGGRRALVEGPARPVGGPVQRLVEGLVVPPEVEHLVLEGGEVHLGRDGAVVAHGVPSGASLRPGAAGLKGREPGSRGTTLLGGPVLLDRPLEGTAAGSTRPDPGERTLFRRLGVIFAPDNTPGLSPSPGRCRLCSELLVPSTPCGATSLPDRAGPAHPGFRVLPARGKLPKRGRALLSRVYPRHILAARVWPSLHLAPSRGGK